MNDFPELNLGWGLAIIFILLTALISGVWMQTGRITEQCDKKGIFIAADKVYSCKEIQL